MNSIGALDIVKLDRMTVPKGSYTWKTVPGKRACSASAQISLTNTPPKDDAEKMRKIHTKTFFMLYSVTSGVT
jgi:hypothetical protein